MLPNEQIARRLDEVADLLSEQGANPYRVRAYRHGAATVGHLSTPLSETFQRKGIDGLREIPGIGDHLATAIQHLVTKGRLPLLEHLRSGADPVALLMTVPGIGCVWAERLHDELGIDSLEKLEAAAHDGRLASVAGLGRKRISGIMDSLATRLGRIRRLAHSPPHDVSVAELLDVDREYRELAQAGKLHRIAPRRFNPAGEAWLPVLHTLRGDHHYTALFSNTALAHKVGKTNDWVILYHDGGDSERQWTVITSQHGLLRGRRIVRGREAECQQHYLALMERGPTLEFGDPGPPDEVLGTHYLA